MKDTKGKVWPGKNGVRGIGVRDLCLATVERVKCVVSNIHLEDTKPLAYIQQKTFFPARRNHLQRDMNENMKFMRRLDGSRGLGWMKSMKVIPEKKWVRIGVRSSSLERPL